MDSVSGQVTYSESSFSPGRPAAYCQYSRLGSREAYAEPMSRHVHARDLSRWTSVLAGLQETGRIVSWCFDTECRQAVTVRRIRGSEDSLTGLCPLLPVMLLSTLLRRSEVFAFSLRRSTSLLSCRLGRKGVS